MNFRDYLAKVEKTYHYRVKSIAPLTDEAMEVVEKVFSKYRPSDITRPKKMMFQTEPLGFTGVKNAEVWFVDLTLTVPGVPAMMEYDLRTAFGLLPSNPTMQVCDLDNEVVQMPAKEEKENEEALLNTLHDEGIPEVRAEEHFGDKYNSLFREYLAHYTTEWKKDMNRDAPNAISTWDNQPDPSEGEPSFDKTHFNKDIK